MKSVRWAGLVVIALTFVWAGKSIGQERKQSGKLEVSPTNGLEISYARLDESKEPHLQYKVVNASSAELPKMAVEMIAYDAKGVVIGAMRWNLRVDLQASSNTHGILATDAKFNSAARVTVKFSPLTSGRAESECDHEFCGQSGEGGKMAVSLCSTGVQSFSCQQGSPCLCKVICQPTGSK